MFHLLIADDTDLIRHMLITLFESDGYHVTSVADGDALVRAALTDHPDLILTDVAMPVMDGLTATRQLRATPATHALPILVSSATDHAFAAARAGANLFLLKPVSIDDLLHAVDVLLTQPVPAEEEH